MRVRHVSDTAHWVAYYRALESDRPDAIFRDPHARRLAGPRGAEIVESDRRLKDSAWAMIVRTAVFDEIILDCVRNRGVDVVLNLAAGLDVRPYRLDLPASLRWIDVDLPAMIEYRSGVLADATPVCRVETLRLDLTDRAGRQALFDRVGREGGRVLVVTEGLLVYLAREQVAELASDLHVSPSFALWLAEIASPRLLKLMRRMYRKSMGPDAPQFRFAPEEGLDFFESLGWHVAEYRSVLEEARRLGRQMKYAWLIPVYSFVFPWLRSQMRTMSAMLLLERAGN